MPTRQAERQLSEFIAKFSPEMGKRICAARAKMRSFMPVDGSHLLVIKSVSAKQRPRQTAAKKK